MLQCSPALAGLPLTLTAVLGTSHGVGTRAGSTRPIWAACVCSWDVRGDLLVSMGSSPFATSHACRERMGSMWVVMGKCSAPMGVHMDPCMGVHGICTIQDFPYMVGSHGWTWAAYGVPWEAPGTHQRCCSSSSWMLAPAGC